MEKIPHNTGIVDPLNVRQYFIMGGLNLVIVINYYSGLHQCSFKKKKLSTMDHKLKARRMVHTTS